MTFVFPAWEFVAKIHLLRLQRLENKVIHNIRNFPMRTRARDMHVAFYAKEVYYYVQ
jgi:hypothetical protein